VAVSYRIVVHASSEYVETRVETVSKNKPDIVTKILHANHRRK